MDTSALGRLADLAFQILGPPLVILAAWLAHRLVRALEARTHLRIASEEEDQLEIWIDQAIASAEEKGRNAARAGLAKVTGPEKLEHAASYVLDLIEHHDYPDRARDLLKRQIEARLAEPGAKTAAAPGV